MSEPLLWRKLQKRIRAGKEDASRIDERQGHSKIKRPDGKLIMVHASSVGETISVMPLVKRLRELHPEINILITTNTMTSAQLLKERYSDVDFIHQYIVWDYPDWVRAFLDHWKPDSIILVESEIWPTFIIEAKKRDINISLINARISERSYNRWLRFSKTARQIFSSLDLILVQSNSDGEKFSKLGGENVVNRGNLKMVSPPLTYDKNELSELADKLRHKNIILAASTHDKEEIMLAQILHNLYEKYPHVFLIIVPRHPERLENILSDLEPYNYHIAVRSRGDEIKQNTNIYIADTIGELGLFYALSPISIIGKSIINHGGQNPLESMRLHSVPIIGPNMENFVEVCDQMKKEQTVIQVETPDDLEEVLLSMIDKPSIVASYITNGKKALQKQGTLIDNMIDKIFELTNLGDKKG